MKEYRAAVKNKIKKGQVNTRIHNADMPTVMDTACEAAEREVVRYANSKKIAPYALMHGQVS